MTLVAGSPVIGEAQSSHTPSPVSSQHVRSGGSASLDRITSRGIWNVRDPLRPGRDRATRWAGAGGTGGDVRAVDRRRGRGEVGSRPGRGIAEVGQLSGRADLSVFNARAVGDVEAATSAAAAPAGATDAPRARPWP